MKRYALAFLALLWCVPVYANYSFSDADAVNAILGEARGEPYAGMVAVGEVIRHRGSLKGLVGRDFSGLVPPHDRLVANLAWQESASSDLTHGATLFENIAAFGFPKSWDREKVVCVAQIGHHWFFKEIR